MSTFEEIFELAFPHKPTERTPEAPSPAFYAREDAQKAAASKIAALREARLQGAKSVEAAPLLYEIVRHRGQWRVLHNSHHSIPYCDQEAAINAALKSARAKKKLGHSVEVRLVRTDGQVLAQAIDPSV